MTAPLQQDDATVRLLALQPTPQQRSSWQAMFDACASPRENRRHSELDRFPKRQARYAWTHGALHEFHLSRSTFYRHVNLSYADDRSVIAMAHAPIGVDLVALTADAPVLDHRIASATDRAAAESLLGPIRTDLATWAAKEAAAKLFDAVDVPPEDWRLQLRPDQPDGSLRIAGPNAMTATLAFRLWSPYYLIAIAQRGVSQPSIAVEMQ